MCTPLCLQVLCINAKLRSVIKVVQLHGTQGGSQLCIFLLAESSNTGVVSETPPKQVCQWLSSKELKEQKSSIDPLALTIVSHVEAKCSTFPLELLDSLDTSGTRVQPRYGTHSLERQMLDEAGYKQPGKLGEGRMCNSKRHMYYTDQCLYYPNHSFFPNFTYQSWIR